MQLILKLAALLLSVIAVESTKRNVLLLLGEMTKIYFFFKILHENFLHLSGRCWIRERSLSQQDCPNSQHRCFLAEKFNLQQSFRVSEFMFTEQSRHSDRPAFSSERNVWPPPGRASLQLIRQRSKFAFNTAQKQDKNGNYREEAHWPVGGL
jgi:hypothetical protein